MNTLYTLASDAIIKKHNGILQDKALDCYKTCLALECFIYCSETAGQFKTAEKVRTQIEAIIKEYPDMFAF